MPNTSKKHKPSEEMMEEVKAGETDKMTLFKKYGATYARMYKAVDHCMQLMQEEKKEYERRPFLKVGIWFGLAGAGKTYTAEQTAIDAGLSMFTIPAAQIKRGWFDGYAGQEVLLLDDFRGSVMEPHEFLNLMDNIPVNLPVKGGYLKNRLTALFISSPDHPINWWPKWYAKTNNNWAQVKRRLERDDQVYMCEADGLGAYTTTKTELANSNLYLNAVESFRVE